MQRPTPRTLVGGTLDPGGASGPRTSSRAFGDRCHTRLLLQCGGRGIACALVAKGDGGAEERKQAPYTSS